MCTQRTKLRKLVFPASPFAGQSSRKLFSLSHNSASQFEHSFRAFTFTSPPGALSAFRFSISCCSRVISSFKSDTNVYETWTSQKLDALFNLTQSLIFIFCEFMLRQKVSQELAALISNCQSGTVFSGGYTELAGLHLLPPAVVMGTCAPITPTTRHQVLRRQKQGLIRRMNRYPRFSGHPCFYIILFLYIW